ncbi:hypothetical protein [Streptomyces sp. NPDC050507]|uniref:hypothetical protein n=1 Tax=Streptomyces sp. NPDC050507 TaxID=3365619 RepID=UPI003794A5BE
MTVRVELMAGAKVMKWDDHNTSVAMVRYWYELKESGALVVHCRTTTGDADGHAVDSNDVEVVYGPAAWSQVSGDD